MLDDLLDPPGARRAYPPAAPSPARPARPGRWPGAATIAPSSRPARRPRRWRPLPVTGAAAGAGDRRPARAARPRPHRPARRPAARPARPPLRPGGAHPAGPGPGAGPRRRWCSAVRRRPGSRAWPSPSRSARRRTSPAPAAISPSGSARGCWREGQGASRFELAFHRLDGRAERLGIGLSLPGRSPDAIARLFAPMLETVDPGFGIEVVTLAAERRRGAARAPDPPASRSARSPRRTASRRWSTGSPTGWARAGSGAPTPIPATSPSAPWSAARRSRRRAGRDAGPKDRPRPVRLFARPEPIEAMARVPDDPPVFFRWRGQLRRVRRVRGARAPRRGMVAPPARRNRPRPTCATTTASRTKPAPATGSSAPASTAPRRPKWWLHGLG